MNGEDTGLHLQPILHMARLTWKIVGYNWSFKQQTSDQQRLEYYEVQVTFKRSILWKYINLHSYFTGFPPAIESNIKAGTVGIPATLPMIASMGFQKLETMENCLQYQ